MKYGMEDSVIEQFYYANMRQQEFIKSRLKKMKLGMPQARTLSYIALHSGTIQKDLAHYLGMQHASVTNLLKNLEQEDYIIRKIPDDNERQKKLYLTEKGAKIEKEVGALFLALEDQIIESISGVEKEQLMEILKKIDQKLESL